MSDLDGRRQIRSIRVDDDIVDWLDGQARDRGVGREVIVEEALRLLRDQP